MLSYQALEDVLAIRIKQAGKIIIVVIALMALCWIIVPGGCLIAQGAKPVRLVGDNTPQSICFQEADGWRCRSLVAGR